MANVVVRSSRVVLQGEVTAASIFVKDGKIEKIHKGDSTAVNVAGYEILDYGNLTVMSGIVDSHVHVNEPGMNTEWEGFETATRAALAGGVTTIVDMPLNSVPVTTSVAALNEKINATKGKLYCDVALLGGIIPGNADQIVPMMKMGVVGFKAFMIHSGLDEFPAVFEEDIRQALQVMKDLGSSDSLFMFHAEVSCAHSSPEKDEDPGDYNAYLEGNPREKEDKAIDLVIRLCAEYNVRCHIVHLSSSNSIDVIRDAKAKGVPISAETTFHYLYFASEEVPYGNTLFKCCPPIREKANRELLWQGLRDGVIGQVISDHSPSTAAKKLLEEQDFNKAWGGISSLQYGLGIFWTRAKERGFTVCDVAKFMSEQTASLVGLEGQKGKIEVGLDADFCVWNPEETMKVDMSSYYAKNPISCYDGEVLSGVVNASILRGKVVYDGTVSGVADRHNPVKRGALLKGKSFQA